MKSHLKSKLYHIFSIISVASVGILHGYDLITIKLIFFFDAFRILFKLDTWDGSYRNDFGTLLSMINLDSDDNNENNSITSDTGRRFRNLKQTDNEDFIEGMITFGYIFGAIFGSYIVSQFTERKSRKLLILISTAIFSIGSFIAACSFRTGNIPFTITLARFIIGMSIGALSVVCPIYISELAPTNYRGMYIFAYHLFVIIGFIISNIISIVTFYKDNVNPSDIDIDNKVRTGDEPINNYYWKLLFVVQGAIGLIYSLIIYKIPESPRWLWFKEENIKARNVFLKLHGRDRETSDIKSIEEYEIIKEDAIYNRAIGYSKYSELWRPDMRRRLFTIWFLFFFQQWTGYMIYKTLGNFVLDYDAVVNMRIYMPVLLTYPFIIIVTLSSMPLVDQFGRKSLLIFGTLLLLSINGSSVVFKFFNTNINKSLVTGPLFTNSADCSNHKIYNDILGNVETTTFYKNTCHEGVYYCDIFMNGISWDKTVFTSLNDYSKIMNEACNERVKDRSLYISIIGQICCVIFMSVFLSTWEPIASIYQAEIFPIRIRGKGASIGIMSKYINQGLITFIGPRLLSSLGKYGFLPFAICSGISFIFISRFCPETTGITLEEIDVMISEKEKKNNGLRNSVLNDLCDNKAKYIIQNDE